LVWVYTPRKGKAREFADTAGAIAAHQLTRPWFYGPAIPARVAGLAAGRWQCGPGL